MDWKQKVILSRQRNKNASLDIVEFEVGKAVVIPRSLPLDKVNEFAQSQYDRMKK